MFPYKDENPTELTPVVTLGIIAVNAMVWLLVQGLGAHEPLARSVCQLGLIPGEVLRTVPPGTSVPLGPGVHCVLTAEPHWSTVLTSMFMHGDRKSTRLNSSHVAISYAVFCLKKKMSEMLSRPSPLLG